MGFVDSAELVARDLGKPLDVDIKSGLVAPRSSVLFQLEHMGHLLRRKESTGPDKRVGFVPDRWQKGMYRFVLVYYVNERLRCGIDVLLKHFINDFLPHRIA